MKLIKTKRSCYETAEKSQKTIKKKNQTDKERKKPKGELTF